MKTKELPEGFTEENVEKLVTGCQKYLGPGVPMEQDEDFYTYAPDKRRDSTGPGSGDSAPSTE